MKILLGVCCLALVFGVAATSLAVEAEQFEFKAALAFDRAIDIAVAGDRILVLSPGTLSVLDGAMLGPMLNKVGSISIGEEYSRLAADGDIAAVATRDGRISIYQLDGDGIAHRADYASGDSVIAMKLVGQTLCLAQGYDGLRIVDLSEPPRPRAIQNLLAPDYSQEVVLTSQFLYVLDALNGVEVYVKREGEYQFFDEIPSYIPLTSISACLSGVAIAYGTGHCDVWTCNTTEGCVLAKGIESEFAVSLIASSHDADTVFYLGSESGELSAVSSETVQSSMPFPIEKILIPEQSALYSVVVLDRSGNVTAFKSNPVLSAKVGYDAATTPGAILAVDGGLVVSNTEGIHSLSFNNGNVDTRLIVPGAPIASVLAELDEYLFAGSALDGTVRRYVSERGRWKAHDEFETGLTLRRLFVRKGSSGEIDLIAVGDEGIKRYYLPTDGLANAICSLTVNERVSCADVRNDWLVTTTENGGVDLYALLQGDVIRVSETRCTARPRDVVVTPEGVVVVAHSGGIDVFGFDPGNGEITTLDTPAAIPTAFDLSYDLERRELLVASGPTPVKYLDFSAPTQLGTVYLIAGTEGTSEITVRGEMLYCLSADWIRVYERSENPAEQQRVSTDFQSVMATPNPFNSETRIAIQLAPSAHVPLPFEVSFVNLLGQTMSRQEFVAVDQSIVIDLPQVIGNGTELPSGVYFLLVRTSGEVVARKLLLLK